MPNVADIMLVEFSDGLITITMTPSESVGGRTCLFSVANRFGSTSPFLTRSCASGYGGGESGITVYDSGNGVFKVVAPTPEEMSGRDPGNYAYQFEFTDSGTRGPRTQGYFIALPNLRRSP